MLTRRHLLRRAAGGALALSLAGCAGDERTGRSRSQRRRVFLDRTLVLEDGARVADTSFAAGVGLEGPAIRVAGRGVELVNVSVDFTEKNGAAIEVLGSATFTDGLVEGGAATGIHVAQDSAELDCVRVTVRDFGSAGHGLGFDSGPGLLRLTDCRAEGCTFAGFHLRGERDGCSLDGFSTRNRIGAFVGGGNGVVERFRSEDDDRFGFYLDKAEGWRLQELDVRRTGATVGEASATGIELWSDSHRNHFGRVVARECPGYGLAIAGGSTENRFESVECDGGTRDSDPGISILNGSHRNHIERATVVAHTVGLRIGENDFEPDKPSDDNRVDELVVERCAYAGVRLEYGAGTRLGTVRVRDCWCSDPLFPGAVSFRSSKDGPGQARDSQIQELEQSFDLDGAPAPPHAVYFGADTSGNRVVSGSASGFAQSAVRDDGDGNTASLSA